MDKRLLEARELIAQGKLDEADKLIKEIREAQDEQTDEVNPDEQPKDEQPKDDEADEVEPEENKDKSVDAERAKALEEDVDKLEKGEARSMENVKKINPTENVAEAEVRAFGEYVRSHGSVKAPELRDIKLEGVEAIVPVDRITQPVTLPETIVDLQNYINVVTVSTTSGSYPILETTNAVMNTVAELLENPKLAEPTFKNVEWKVETFRGYIPMSNEAIQDSDPDLVALIAKHLTRIALNTINKAVMTELLAKFAPTEVTSLDQLKTASNVTIDPAYNQRVFVSQSAFAQLDTLKDADGRYIIQPNVTMASGKTLFGKEVVVLPDAIFKNDTNDKLLFIGDLEQAITLFKRTEMTVRWQDHNVYGEMLAGAIRFDVVATDTKAGLMFKLGAIPNNVSTVTVANASEFPSGGAEA